MATLIVQEVEQSSLSHSAHSLRGKSKYQWPWSRAKTVLSCSGQRKLGTSSASEPNQFVPGGASA